LWLAARWGGAFTPLGVAFLLDYVSWRRAFEIFGLLGIIWAFFSIGGIGTTHDNINK
jgi:hypothetical protein